MSDLPPDAPSRGALSRRDLLARSAFGALPLLGLPTADPTADPTPQPPRTARPPRTRDYVVEASAALRVRGIGNVS